MFFINIITCNKAYANYWSQLDATSVVKSISWELHLTQLNVKLLESAHHWAILRTDIHNTKLFLLNLQLDP